VLCAALLLGAGGVAPAAQPAKDKDKKDESVKLKEYSVGASKNVRIDEPAIEIERPKIGLEASGGLGIEKPVLDVTPMTVKPVTASARPEAPKPAAPAPVPVQQKPAAPPVAVAAQSGSTPALAPPAAAPRAAPSPAGAGPAVGGLVAIETPPPDYPREAALAGTEGYVIVEFALDAAGVPQDITIVDSNPRRTFDQAARRAVMRWRFQPYLVDGVPSTRRIQRRIDFTL
jgi:protein TonB